MAIDGLGYGVLIVVTGYVLADGSSDGIGNTMYIILLSHGILGLLNRFKSTSMGSKLYKLTEKIVELAPLPLYNTMLYLNSGMRPEVAYLHTASAVIPLACEMILNEGNSENLKDLVIISNVASTCFLAMTSNNFAIVPASLMTACNRFAIGEMSDVTHLASNEIISIGLAAFALLSWMLQKA